MFSLLGNQFSVQSILKNTADFEKESGWLNKEKSKELKELLCHKDMFMITQMLYDSARKWRMKAWNWIYRKMCSLCLIYNYEIPLFVCVDGIRINSFGSSEWLIYLNHPPMNGMYFLGKKKSNEFVISLLKTRIFFFY